MRWLLPLLLLTGCGMDVPFPERCQRVGVAVADNDTITGTIITEHTGTVEKVSIECRSPFKPKYGCAIPINDGEYVLWYVDTPENRDHERCHALYEEPRHTNAY